MASDQEPPARPRRERPLVAAGREPKESTPPPPPTVLTPPTGNRVFEPPIEMTVGERQDRVDVAFPGPTEQRRWTIAIRIILVIPHLFWLYILNIGLGCAVFIAWFAALFTKRVPDEIATFIGKVVRYQTRVQAYGFFLLTDEYPPFGLNAEHGIDLNVNPGEFSRSAVFFRWILMVPSAIVGGLATVGATMLGVISWLLALILGRLPQPLWEANAAVVRYTARTQAFAVLLTAEQPKGIFGDKPSTVVPPLPDTPAEAVEFPTRPRIVRLVLSQGGKRMVVFFMVLAAVVYGGFFVTIAVMTSRIASAIGELDDAYTALTVDIDAYGATTQQCAFTRAEGCLRQANLELADGFGDFAEDVADIEFPANLGPTELIDDARACESALRAMAAATDEASYNAAVAEYQRAAEAFDQEYATYSGDLEYES